MNHVFEAQGGIQSHNMQLYFPKFDGTNPTSWFFHAQQFFAQHNTLDNLKIQLALFHMEGKALTWYQWLLGSHPISTWPKFAPTPFDDPVVDFTNLRQVSIVEEYQTNFEILSNHIPSLIELFRISTFLSNSRTTSKSWSLCSDPQLYLRLLG